ncbi:MAG: autotransporter outer membrane beta-barrel domain-containing protein [Arenimonas sp.]
MKKNNRAIHGTRLAVTNAIASAMLLVYGRSAYAGTCVETPVASGNWVCSGAAGADTAQPIIGSPVTVTTTPGFGINTAAGNALTVTGNGGLVFTDAQTSFITGADGAIHAVNNATGSMNITTNGTAIGNMNGIYARNYGSGTTNIITTGMVSGTFYSGINARSYGNGLSITAADVTGGLRGISANNLGSGSTIITATGTITGTIDSGILGTNFGNADNLTITANNVVGGQVGIRAQNMGSGETNINTTGAISGTAATGIYAVNVGAATDLTIMANNVYGGQNGILVDNSGIGATTVSITGTAIGNTSVGIGVTNAGTATDLTITAADVIGGNGGIGASNRGTGATTITTTGTVTGQSFGIAANNLANATDMTITAVDVTGGQYGIRAFAYGTGANTVTVTGTVTGTAVQGIAAQNNVAGTDLTVTAVDVTGGQLGIGAFNQGTGATTVTSTGTVTGNTYLGIDARTSASGLTINAVNVTGGRSGIYAINIGTGATTVTTTGTVTATNYFGILATTGPYGTDITVTTVDVSGGRYGISTTNYGSGSTTIMASGLTSGLYNGISATNLGTDLTITANDVSGRNFGILAANFGSGAMVVNSTGTVTSATGRGIAVRNEGTDLTINTMAVTGGIHALSYGTGISTITANGLVTGGIHARNSFYSTGLTISAASVTDDRIGIEARNYGYGATSITSTGTVSGTNYFGIYARNLFGTDLSIAVADVHGGFTGIHARGYLTGNINITSSGTVSGTTTDGIYSITQGTTLAITANHVSGGQNGISVAHNGTGPTTISVNGNITGGTGYGINTQTTADNSTTINLAATSSVTASSGNAIVNNFGNSIVNMASGAVINGTVRLNAGDDVFNVANGASMNSITALDGGDDALLGDGFVDILNLNSAWSGNLNGANIVNWEFININGGTVGFSNAAITAGQINVNNFGSLNGSNNLSITGNAAVASGSRIIAGNTNGTNAMNISGNLFNAGSVQLSGPTGQQAAGDRLTVAGNYHGSGGTLVLDTVLNTDTSASDQLVVAGNTSGSTGIIVNNVGGLGAMTTGDGIMLINVAGNSAANAFNLNNSVVAGAFNYRLYQNGIVNPADGDWYLRSSARGITSPAMAIPDMGKKVGLSMLGSLQERLGEQDKRGTWIRVVGNSGQQTFESNIGNFEGRNDSHFIQAGTDLYQSENNRWGVFAAKAQSTTHLFDTDIDPDLEAGIAKVEGYAVGVYATHRTDTYYWDAVLQHSWLDATVNGEGDSFKTDSKHWLASFEFGRDFKFGSNNSLEPQAQLIVGKGSTVDATDGFTSYNYSSEDVLVGRLGVRWTHAQDETNVTGSFVPFLKANVSRNFGDDSFVQIGASDITTERDDIWGEIGFGFSILTQHNWSIFMQYDYEKGLGQSDLENHSGTIGLRRNW